MHETHTKKLWWAYLRSIEGKPTIYWILFIYLVKGQRSKVCKMDTTATVSWVCSLSCKSLECLSSTKIKWSKCRCIINCVICQWFWQVWWFRSRSWGSLPSSTICSPRWFILETAIHRKLSEDEKKNLTRDIEAMHEQWVRINWVNPKAVQCDVDAAFSGMENEVSWFYLTSRIKKCWLNC